VVKVVVELNNWLPLIKLIAGSRDLLGENSLLYIAIFLKR
jgi:hypothetical protein